MKTPPLLSEPEVIGGRCPVCGATVDFDPAEFMEGHNVCHGHERYFEADHYAAFEPVYETRIAA